MIITSVFSFGAYHFWQNGVLNSEYVSSLYDGSNKIKIVKDRNDLDDLKRLIEGDRTKESNKVLSRLEQDIKELKLIKNTKEYKSFDANFESLKNISMNLQNNLEFAVLVNNVGAKIINFENLATEKRWPTLTKMAVNLRNKTSQSRLVSGGLITLERVSSLSQVINNDLEAMKNFTNSSGLNVDVKNAIIGRLKSISTEAENLNNYINNRKNFIRIHKDFSNEYRSWFKLVEPEIALKKIQFEKNSQILLVGIIVIFTLLVSAITLGILIFTFSNRIGSRKVERLILDTLRDDVLPLESKKIDLFSIDFKNEFKKYHEHIHRRMSFGNIFREAMPFASILLDSNLNLIWGNTHFYEEWRLENFKKGDDSLSWDFLQRFTNLDDNSIVLSALRLSTPGSYKILVKTTQMEAAVPYHMHVSPIEYLGQKRIMIIFSSLVEYELNLVHQSEEFINCLIPPLEAQRNGLLTVAMRAEMKAKAEKNNLGQLFKSIFEYVDQKENEIDEKNLEIERLEILSNTQSNMIAELRRSIVYFYEQQKNNIIEFNHLKDAIATILDNRDQIEEQFKFILNCSRDVFKDQNKIISNAEKAEISLDEYIKSVKVVAGLKSEFKVLKCTVEEFKSRIVQVLDQLLIFQNSENDHLRIEQLLGKIKIEMKGFEKILYDFNRVITQLDVTVTKIDLMIESREKIEMQPLKLHMDTLKNNIDNIHFSANKFSQASQSKDDEMINSLKFLVSNLKQEIKIVDEMCKVSGLTEDHLKAITSTSQATTEVRI
jgi:hypothetical protein